jgi:GNAT superfamily N-acetyltransferase
VTAALGILPLEIRPADGFADWPGLLVLLRRAFAYMEGRIDPPSSLHRLDAAGLAAKAGAERCFLAYCADRLVGCVFCDARVDCLYVGKLAVEPELQGRGIGRALMALAAAEARALDLAALELQTRVELVENHRAFERLGFVRTGETAHAGYDRPTSVTMRKVLG